VNRGGVARQIAEEQVIAVVRLRSASMLRDVVEALVEGGIRIVELTMTIPGALHEIRQLATSLPASVVLGAGTVVDTETAVAAIDGGARFIVSPVCRTALIAECHRRDAVIMPGCFTPTEILSAWEAGADFVKVFPASALKPSFIRDVRAPFPDMRLVPTGGIGIDDAVEWLGAGAAAVGVGGALLDPHAIGTGNFHVLTAAAQRLVGQVRKARASSGGIDHE
jgi:2-dehydro-3-deoxyphosphogluconate aldolase/(4S)-4-hydroxy-2-oxoglutarate aldolase